MHVSQPNLQSPIFNSLSTNPHHLPPLRRRLLKGKLRDISIGKTDAKYKMRFPQVK